MPQDTMQQMVLILIDIFELNVWELHVESTRYQMENQV